MELKFVEAKNMKSLEDYLCSLVVGIISLETLESFHERAINLGVLKEDQECRANTIIWDYKRLIKLYYQQADAVLDLLPDEYTIDKVIEQLKDNEIIAAKKLTKKPKANNDR